MTIKDEDTQPLDRTIADALLQSVIYRTRVGFAEEIGAMLTNHGSHICLSWAASALREIALTANEMAGKYESADFIATMLLRHQQIAAEQAERRASLGISKDNEAVK